MEQSVEITNWVAKAKLGDSDAFSELYRSAYKLVYMTCLGHLRNPEDAEDTTQEVFITVYNKLASLQDNRTFMGWVKTIAVHSSLNKLAARKNNIYYDDAIESNENIEGDDNLENLPDAVIMEETKRNTLLEIMNAELSEVQYQTIFMFYYNEMSIDQIASAMKCPVSTVKKRLKVSRIKIKDGIENYERKTGDRLCAAGTFPALGMLFRSHLGHQSAPFVPFAGFSSGAAGAVGGAAGKAVAGAAGKAAAAKIATKAATKAATKTAAKTAASATVKHAGKAAAVNGAKGASAAAAKTASSAAAVKVIAGVSAVGILGIGTVAVAKSINKNAKTEPTEKATKPTIEETVVETTPAPTPISYGIGDKFVMGNYKGEDVTWRILDIEGDNYFVVSEYAIDVVPYNVEREEVTWEECTMRTWLNEDFYNSAFSSEEQSRILTTTVTADTNPEHETEPGNDTEDRLFLLSVNEVNRYLSNEHDRICYASEYLKTQDIWISDDSSCRWWLRTPGFAPGFIVTVNFTGDLVYDGSIEDNEIYVARPAMWVEIIPEEEVAAPEVIETTAVETTVAETTVSTQESVEATEIQADANVEISCQIGDTITFGQYYGEPIYWEVLDEQDGNYLLLSRNILDASSYNDEWVDTTWESSSIRSWLNDTFYTHAFTSAQRENIVLTTVTADPNPTYTVDSGNDTQDYVFLLSIDEVNRYFDSDDARVAFVTQHGIDIGCWSRADNKAGWWWLRTPGGALNAASGVDFYGVVSDAGNYVDVDYYGVRPAIWVSFN